MRKFEVPPLSMRIRALWTLVLSLTAASVLAACSDNGPVGPESPELTFGLTVSEPVAVSSASGAMLAGDAAGVVYVSASPGSFPDGVSATITNLTTNSVALSTDIIDGGFDPVAIEGSVGDQLEIVVRNRDGSEEETVEEVPDERRPRVVRTQPPKDATDVSLNAGVSVVFSEPIDTATARDGFQLTRGSDPVDGTLIFDSDALRLEFQPSAALVPGTTYTLTLTTQVQDLTGADLETEVTASFTTESSVASVTVTPETAAIAPSQQLGLQVTLEDESGRLLDRQVTWSSSDESVASVNEEGIVTGVQEGTATITATSEGVSDSAMIDVVVPASFARISAWSDHSCGVTPDGVAYCWGNPDDGRLGISQPLPNNQLLPAVVQGGHALSEIAVGGLHTCAFGDEGYCWGHNWGLGNGDESDTNQFEPARITGAISITGLSDIAAGSLHACGVTPNGEAYCWGESVDDQLGDGVSFQNSGRTHVHSPVQVVGGYTFVSVTAGLKHSCGLTDTGKAYCWGSNWTGQLGSPAPGVGSAPEPVEVSGGYTFTSLSAGGRHTCGLTDGGDVYCWGRDSWGQLGVGTASDSCGNDGAPCSRIPLLTSGGHEFVFVNAGGNHTCGITSAEVTYCWGRNDTGQLGDGSTSSVSTPQPTLGGFQFSSISGGWWHTCGLTVDGEAYCWGQNDHGQLGDGTTADRLTPVKISQ